MSEHTEIQIGDFTFTYLSNGNVWLSRESGEGMELGDESASALESILEQFWEANF